MTYKEIISNSLKEILEKDVSSLVEVPPKQELGDFAFPCFSLSKELRKSPAQIASDLVTQINISGMTVKSTGPYLNFFIDNTSYVENILVNILSEKEAYGSADSNGDLIIIDYCAPNVAKNMGIHNLRSTIIGQTLCNVYRFLGYDVKGINHLGDWGTQFGKLIWALESWSSPDELSKKGIIFLNDMYVKYHEQLELLEKNSESDKAQVMEDEARAWFKKIELGDPKAKLWWDLFVNISMNDYNQIFDRLNIVFDETKGESYYIPFIDGAISQLNSKNLTEVDDGALVVKFDESENVPPFLLKKTDGATLYGTRDLAAAFYRLNSYGKIPSKVLYATDIAQAFHFKQLFKVLELVDQNNNHIFEHIQFGRLSFPDISMSTRKGNIVPLRDVLDKASEKALTIINEKSPDLENKLVVAEQIGVGAVVFADLIHDRIHNIVFEWDKILDFQGETSPYIQYTVTRINSIFTKVSLDETTINYNLISSESDKKLVKILANFHSTLLETIKNNKPHHTAKYILSLAQAFNGYYVHNQIIQDNLELQNARLALCSSVKQVLETGLKLLGIESPIKM